VAGDSCKSRCTKFKFKCVVQHIYPSIRVTAKAYVREEPKNCEGRHATRGVPIYRLYLHKVSFQRPYGSEK
jgi:hypothetical protein